MNVKRYGSGPQMYLGLPGWNGDHRTFLPLVDNLPACVSFMSADLPGTGETPLPADWNLDRVATEIADKMEGPTTLVGNCSGALLALMVARRIPLRVQRVVMIEAFAYWPWYFRVFLARWLGRRAYMATFANPVGRWLTNTALIGKRRSTSNLTRGFQQADHASIYRNLVMLRDAGTVGEFAGLTMPIDVLYGARTFTAVRQSARVWARLWPHARTWELPGAGHLPIVETAPQIKEILFGENHVR